MWREIQSTQILALSGRVRFGQVKRCEAGLGGDSRKAIAHFFAEPELHNLWRLQFGFLRLNNVNADGRSAETLHAALGSKPWIRRLKPVRDIAQNPPEDNLIFDAAGFAEACAALCPLPSPEAVLAELLPKPAARPIVRSSVTRNLRAVKAAGLEICEVRPDGTLVLGAPALAALEGDDAILALLP
jgi:hypothetical protein